MLSDFPQLVSPPKPQSTGLALIVPLSTQSNPLYNFHSPTPAPSSVNMVQICAAAVVAAMVVAPAIAAPLTQTVENVEAREFDDFESEFVARSEDIGSALEARAGMPLRFFKNGVLPATSMFATVLGGMTAAKPLFQKKERRSFDDFEELESREPAGPVAKGRALAKFLPWVSTIATGAAGGAGLGLGAYINSKSRRDFDEAELLERELGVDAFDDVDARELEDLLDFYARALDVDFDELD